MSLGTFSDTLIRLKALKKIIVFCRKLDNRHRGFLVKNDQILKLAFFTCLCPKGSQRVAKRP